MAGEKIEKSVECIESNLKTTREAFEVLVKLEPDPAKKQLNTGIISLIDGVLEKISRTLKALGVTDTQTLERIDFEVQESGFSNFCDAFKTAVTKEYPKDSALTKDVVLSWDRWKNKIEYWLESVESTIEAWSEITVGSAAQGVLEIFRKAITSLAKAISSTKRN